MLKKETTINDKRSEEALSALLLIALFQEIETKTQRAWNELYNENGNAFDNKIFSLISRLKDSCEERIKCNYKLYRARTYKNSEIKNIYDKPFWKELFTKIQTKYPFLFEYSFSLNDIEFGSDFCNKLILLQNNKFVKKILTSWIKKYKKIKFWGYERNESGRNYKNIKEGRMNKVNEHHLYLASDIETAIAEVRPLNMQQVSVATVNIKKELKLFDFTKKFKFGDGTKDCDYISYEYVSKMCSIPNYNDNDLYKPTQMISSYIRKLGFDGIIYPSSLNEYGKNILIFEFASPEVDNDYFEIISTDVYQAKNEIKIKKILPIGNN